MACPQAAELLLVNGTIYTGAQPGRPLAALAIADGRVVAVGSEAKRCAGPQTRVIDLAGATVLPGFIDAHAHPRALGESFDLLDLRQTVSPEAVARKVADFAKRRAPGSWIVGRGWDQNLWSSRRFPTKAVLDAVTSQHPVVLFRIDGHACWVNSVALRLANIDRNTPDPPGGKILRLPDGSPSGVLVDRAQTLVTRHIPPPSFEQVITQLKRALAHCARLGLTMIHDAGADELTIQAYLELERSGQLPIRVYAMIPAPSPAWDEWRKRGPYRGQHLTIQAVKLIADGALGSRGAALLDDYADDPGNRGLLLLTPEQTQQLIRQAMDTGFQVATHAIGDAANRMVLDVYAAYLKPGNGRRFRIEHAQVIAPEDFARFGQLSVIASIQPTHATSDMAWAPARLGSARLAGAYAWRKLLQNGAVLACGSDFPVEDPNPLLGIYAAITRQDLTGHPPGGWFPHERMTRDEALRCWTWAGAYAAFLENELGELAPGKRADLVVLSGDILRLPESEIPKVHVKMTMVDGKIVYQEP